MLFTLKKYFTKTQNQSAKNADGRNTKMKNLIEKIKKAATKYELLAVTTEAIDTLYSAARKYIIKPLFALSADDVKKFLTGIENSEEGLLYVEMQESLYNQINTFYKSEVAKLEEPKDVKKFIKKYRGSEQEKQITKLYEIYSKYPEFLYALADKAFACIKQAISDSGSQDILSVCYDYQTATFDAKEFDTPAKKEAQSLIDTALLEQFKTKDMINYEEWSPYLVSMISPDAKREAVAFFNEYVKNTFEGKLDRKDADMIHNFFLAVVVSEAVAETKVEGFEEITKMTRKIKNDFIVSETNFAGDSVEKLADAIRAFSSSEHQLDFFLDLSNHDKVKAAQVLEILLKEGQNNQNVKTIEIGVIMMPGFGG